MIKWIIHLFLVVFSTSVFAQNEVIFIYNDEGVSQESFAQVKHSVEEVLGSEFEIETLCAKQVINDPWEDHAALFIMPGGADVPYSKLLHGLGNQKIRSYVENGGSYLGLCAGSYYAGNFVDFAKGTPIQVEQKRQLAFFPGTVRGPILATYYYNSNRGARAARVISANNEIFPKGKSVFVFYNGGGTFVGAPMKENTTILATYDSGHSAIIQCKVGQGVAILSGVHFEYDPYLLDSNDPYLKKIIPTLIKYNKSRLTLLNQVLFLLLDR